jgi:membrane protease YdiL (CAAX protease family)
MTTADPLPEIPKRKLGVAIWLAGMLGVLAMTYLMLPVLIAQHPRPRPLRFPIWVASLGASVESAVLLAVFVWMGVAFAPRLGLRAPAFEALVSGRPLGAPLRPQLLPGLIGALVAAAIPWYFTSHGLILEIHTPRALAAAVLYGGITEEIVMRWGMMTLFIWLGWRFFQKNEKQPSPGLVWAAIIVSAVIFGAGHLPSTYILTGHLTGSMIARVIAGGTLFGVIAGHLYRRYGFESAIVCHALSHLFAYAAGLMAGQF